MAKYSETGKEIRDPNYPFMLRFEPNPDLHVTNGDTPFFDQLSGDTIAPGTTLFKVFAVDIPTRWDSP